MPKPFRLQALLEHKRQQEGQQTLVLAERDAERRRACDVLETLREAEAAHLHHLDALAGATRIDAERQRDAVSYLGRIETSMAVQREVIAVTAGASSAAGRKLSKSTLPSHKARAKV